MTTTRPGRWCSRVLDVAVWLLPAAQRQRYGMEFVAELYGMPRSRQVRHSFQVLVSAVQLRAALNGAASGEAIVVATKRPIQCVFGRHRWQTVSTEDGINHWQCCANCGKDRRQNMYARMNLPGGGAAWPGG